MPERAEARAEIVPMPGPVAATVAARDAYARDATRVHFLVDIPIYAFEAARTLYLYGDFK